MKTVLHVNQHIIKQKGECPLTAKTYKGNSKSNRFIINGPSALVYEPDDPLSCGARCWIETHSVVEEAPVKDWVPNPDISLNVYLVEYGYQADIIVNGQKFSTCRDFGGDHKISQLKEKLYQLVSDAIEEFRKDL